MGFLLAKSSSIFLSIFLIFCLICLSDQRITNNNNNHNNNNNNNDSGITVDLIHRSMIESPSAPITPVNSGEYMMKIRIGTPPVEVLGVANIGSDLTWTQCTPCNHCEKQQLPLFDPTKSKTYKNISCGSDRCALLDDIVLACRNDTEPCKYSDTYGSVDRDILNSGSRGEVGLETFDLGFAFPDVVFGCGYANNATSGIVGLGNGPSSIVRQFAGKAAIGGAKFSYCLTSPDTNNVSSKITFGSNARVTGPKVVSTPLKKGDADERRYYVTLAGVSVGDKRLEYDSRELRRYGNMIVDLGGTQTQLEDSLYDRLVSELASAITSSNRRVPDPRNKDGLCYAAGNISSPAVTLHFDGRADLVLPPESTFVEVADAVGKGVVCLTFSRTASRLTVPVLGNIHQRNHIVEFDLDNRKLNFLPTDCTN